MDKPKFISSAEAIKFLPKRNVIHCFAGMIGADWSKKDVIKELKRAKRIAWVLNIFNHNLAIEPSEKSNWECVLKFDVQFPKK